MTEEEKISKVLAAHEVVAIEKKQIYLGFVCGLVLLAFPVVIKIVGDNVLYLSAFASLYPFYCFVTATTRAKNLKAKYSLDVSIPFENIGKKKDDQRTN